jgi:hypothetical protein
MQGTDWHKRIPICGPVRLSWVAIRAPKNSDAVDGNSVALQNHPPEFHRFVAQSELERGGNLQRGAIHLAWLLSLAPNNPSIQLLEQCLQVTGDDHLSLYPESGTGHRHNACEAVREYILARLGRLPEAIDLLVAVVSANRIRVLSATVQNLAGPAGGWLATGGLGRGGVAWAALETGRERWQGLRAGGRLGRKQHGRRGRSAVTTGEQSNGAVNRPPLPRRARDKASNDGDANETLCGPR